MDAEIPGPTDEQIAEWARTAAAQRQAAQRWFDNGGDENKQAMLELSMDTADIAHALLAERAALAAENERLRAALKYAGVGEPYPHNRLVRLIQDERAKCRNKDDRDYWRHVEESLTAALAGRDTPNGGE